MKTKIISKLLLSLSLMFVLGSAITQVRGDSPSPGQLPVVSIHSTGDVTRGKTGSFVLDMSQSASNKAYFPYVNFKVSGTAIAGVDYVSLTSPTSIGKSGYGVISLKTLANPRGSSDHKAYSVVVTLEPGAGYAVSKPNSAIIWITTGCELEACW